MSTRPDSETPARHAQPEPQTVDISRRRLGMGLGVSAVFTLASRPVLAAQCMAASAAASGNLSSPGSLAICTGLTPAQWVALAQSAMPNDPNNSTQNSFPGGNVKFHDVLASGSSANWGNDTRLYVVMATGIGATVNSRRGGFLGSPANSNASGPTSLSVAANGPNPISMEFAATLLNIRDSRIPTNVLNETDLIGMWNEWLTTNLYAPMAGATWDGDQIVGYLRTLQGA
jgi:hypothetical protein